jgi:hypothetical protein|nr:MAG TPA: hypothetical protein [Caudoviricetes sp.]
MTQKEFDFISEACYAKLSSMLNGLVADTNELQELRDAKKAQKEPRKVTVEKVDNSEKAKK